MSNHVELVEAGRSVNRLEGDNQTLFKLEKIILGGT